ncbi:serine/threonine-protein kinase [Paenibacillus sp. RS8]|uniref:serine/threonine-protein kinase n=1 Tax=Paenibacillus sp. RS8 TaxID=3242681 RepID=UPI0035C0FAFC
MRVETRLTFIRKQDIGGEGRNSEVFIAEDIQLNAEIVVKSIEKKKLADLNITDYFSEAKILYASTHPNIVEMNYSCEDDKFIYLSMPMYKNGSINSLMNKRYLSVREIITYSLEFLSGVHYIHTKGLLHFDIKPTNILISDSNTALLTDFGLAKYINEYGFAQPDLLYPPHRAPESYNVGSLDVYHDIYHCGLTIYRMCNGNAEFANQLRTAKQSDVLAGTFPDRNKYLPHIPKSIQNVIKKALAVNPKDRYDTVLALLNDLSKIDKNLDWKYTEDALGGTYVWSLEEDKTIKYIQVVATNSQWKIEGKQYSKATLKTTNVSKWNSNGYNSIQEAFKKVTSLIYEHENPKK